MADGRCLCKIKQLYSLIDMSMSELQQAGNAQEIITFSLVSMPAMERALVVIN